METALISIVSLALIIISSVTMMLTSFTSFSSITDSLKTIEKESDIRRRTDISVTVPQNYEGGTVELFVSNDGHINLGNFSDWDIFIRYQSGEIDYLDYTENSEPAGGQWTLESIYLTENITVSEVFDSAILNPGESAKLLVNPGAEIPRSTYSLVTVSTFNGVVSQCHLYRP